MSLICQCPAAAAITTIPNVTCPENFGQIQKVAFQRLQKASGARNSFTTTADIKLKASWTSLLTAEDGSKVVISPYINAPADSGGDARMTSAETMIWAESPMFWAVTPFNSMVPCVPSLNQSLRR